MATGCDERGQHGRVGNERKESVVQDNGAVEAVLAVDRTVPAVVQSAATSRTGDLACAVAGHGGEGAAQD